MGVPSLLFIEETVCQWAFRHLYLLRRQFVSGRSVTFIYRGDSLSVGVPSPLFIEETVCQ